MHQFRPSGGRVSPDTWAQMNIASKIPSQIYEHAQRFRTFGSENNTITHLRENREVQVCQAAPYPISRNDASVVFFLCWMKQSSLHFPKGRTYNAEVLCKVQECQNHLVLNFATWTLIESVRPRKPHLKNIIYFNPLIISKSGAQSVRQQCRLLKKLKPFLGIW